MGLRRSVRGLVLACAGALALAGLTATLIVLLSFSRRSAALEDYTRRYLEDEATAQRIQSGVYEQVIEISRYTTTPDPASQQRFRSLGMQVYADIRDYLFRDLSVSERLLVENLKEIHERFEVHAQEAFILAGRGDVIAARQRGEALSLNAAQLLRDLDHLMDARESNRNRLLAEQAAAIQWLYAMTALLVLSGGVAIFLLVRVLERRIIAPVRTIAAGVSSIAAGELETRVPATSADELGMLARNFNDMAARLQQARRDLIESENTLRQSQKMEAVGRLAGGVAHDFNNILTAIRGHAELLLESEVNASRREDIEEIAAAADRAARLTRQLLAFSRQQVLRIQNFDPNEVISGLARLLQRLIGADIDLGVVLSNESLRLCADQSQFEQIVMNLALNARDAMPNGGRLTISTFRSELTGGLDGVPANVPHGTWIVLRVQDTGLGMTPEVQARIFEPFFTTKELGRGTGLGLSTVYGIVQQSSGHIWVESEPGRGSVFTVLLPLVQSVVEEEPTAEKLIAAGPGGTLLLVEDEPAVRAFAARVLERHGYRVLQAENGEDALQVARAHPGEIRGLVTDIVMPRLGGLELAERLSDERPDLRILIMSGYTEDELPTRFRQQTAVFLPKPFTVTDLLDAARRTFTDTAA